MRSFMLLVVLVGACDFGRLPRLNDDAGIDAPTDAVPATKLLLASGNNQRGMPGVALHAPFAVTVEDASGNPVSGFMVAFAVTAGSGSVSSASVATDAQGQAQTTLTPGTSGANTVEASGTGLAGSPIVFTAVAGFDAEVEFPVGISPGFPAIGDVNGDGKLDIMVNSANDSTLSVLLNTAATGATAPGFAPRSVLNMPGLPLGVAIADLNGDGKPDVAAASFPNGTAAVYLNTTATGSATASFTSDNEVQVGTHPADLAIGDLNGDNVPDIALADFGAASVSVLINQTTTGSATPSLVRTDFATGNDPISIVLGDFNGDGKPDIAVANQGSNGISVLLNTTPTGSATPTFASQVDFATGSSPNWLAVGDVNGDGKPDLAVVNSNDTVSILLNTTPTNATMPTFAIGVDFATGSGPTCVAIADLDGDGKPDLAVVNQTANTVSVLLNNTTKDATTPSLAPKSDFATGQHPLCAAIGDLNGDGVPDLAVANFVGDTVSVLLDATVPPDCPTTCGPNGTSDCCASSVVPGNATGATNAGDTFFRSYDVASDGLFGNMGFPATVSDYRLDTYSVTVGRFRAFVNAGLGTQANPPAAGSGAHAKIANSGWNPSDDVNLTANPTALEAALLCNSASQTWTDTPSSNENLPINCVTWYEAFAFCIWDGGYLPTEAEWNYAAAGGSDQRAYPFSNPASSVAIDCTQANFEVNAAGTFCVNGTAGAVNRVGTESPAGDGRFGQADLAGDVWSWNLDWSANYTNPCNDCADLTPASDRVIRGGSFDDLAVRERAANRDHSPPTNRTSDIGIRCARTP